MSSVYLPPEVKSRLIRAAQRRGFAVGRGRTSQLADYIAYLVNLDERFGGSPAGPATLPRALGLLAAPGRKPSDDEQVEELLAERRLKRRLKQ
ncbi:MAG: hypothetical protein AB1758_21635 [Candidatus Eremiobacterota bacterium]